MNEIIPLPQVDVSVRDATLADVPFIDRLQKMHGDAVGFMRTSWIEAKIAAGQVIVAEEVRSPLSVVSSEERSTTDYGPLTTDCRVGYCMGVDRYFKRDDVGIIHQMNVVPGRQRAFVGATLLKAMFDRAAYGCRLFCCWCAQDLKANYFWEAMGFVPLAFRAGSEKRLRIGSGIGGCPRPADRGVRIEGADGGATSNPQSEIRNPKSRGRTHIFWQKRIREGDVGERATPWWFPAKTDAGSMRADRIVLPIPPGKHWSDEMPRIVPEEPEETKETAKPAIADGRVVKKSRVLDMTPPPANGAAKRGVRQFDAPPAKPVVIEPVAKPDIEKPRRVKKPKPTCPERSRRKADPKMIAAARELRDRWLEHVNAGEMLIEGAGKYDVSRALAGPTGAVGLLPAA